MAAGVIRRLLGAACCLLAMLAAGSARGQERAQESSVKATFLYRFASFVTWPAAAFAEPDSPVVICVDASSQMGAAVARAVADQRLNGHPFVMRRVEDPRAVAGCHILYLGDGDEEVRMMLRAAHDAPILTVTDANATPDVRGVVHFVLVDNRVRFHIDDARAAEGGLAIDPRLLSLALSVRRRPS